ncbi:uncharacterized protein LOC130014246 [Patella vulgata]|uniref:uncharacterized protein LOC126815886 n=2 Tax=Patella vulgata TaxID=6465 RepID=UPI002180133B|nr:uncharacterized protein LOC126815886 [Patella vulgata]XP_055956728.1 uncharacterized protein LOC130012812 [Patella vulgata]XP_055959132.1 uncharacterized protein LOC130014245 [Patella vulgata]XP_055959133.1 uncharacterized protein LOC130014246 [Patella vulgata]
MTCTDDQNSILLQTAVGFVCANHNDNSRGLYKNIVFDLCSQRTYVTDETRRLLNLRTVGRENLLIKTFGEETPKLRLCDIVQFTVAGDDGLHLYVTAHCVPSICNAISDQLTCNALVKYPHLRGLKLANPSGPSDFAVDILIGADFYWNFFCGETRRGEFPGPVAMLTKLGWVLSGPVINNSSSDQCTINLSHTHVLHVSSVSDDNCDVSSIKSELNKFWELESLGIRNDESSVLSDFNDNITFEGKRYEVKLPFKENHLKISDNYSTCVKRLSSLLYRLNSKPDVLKEYDRIINEQLSEGKSYGVPLAPPLPEFRLSDDFAFTNIGVDYAGPLYVKDIYSKSGEMNKVFIVLYTCASSRAVHLDLATDASSSSFIRSFRRFIGRRGVPTLVNSDNGLVFKSAELRAFTNSRNIKWCYNIERSPWWGGFFERMVRSTKRCLKKALGNAHLSYEELLTLLVDIEGVLNSRPLTYLSDDCIEPLTPSHLVLGRRILSEPLFTPNPKVVGNTSSEFCKRKKYLQTVINHYWSRWRNDYVTQLREHHRSRVKTGPIIREGDIVLVFDDKVSRLNWEMGRVDRILPGRDNNVRSAVVRVQNKQGKIIFMNRPIQKLYPIELVRD